MVRPGRQPGPDRRSIGSHSARSFEGCHVARSRPALHRTRMVEGTEGSHHKEGAKKMSKHSMVCAGIDTSKGKLAVAVTGVVSQLQVKPALDGYVMLSAWLRQHKVERI